MRGIQNLGYSRVNAYDITTNLAVRIAGIDGVNAETAAKTRGINILREAEYAQLPEVIAGVDSRGVMRSFQDFEINSSWEITRYKGNAKDVVIPATIFGYSFTGIGNVAFAEVASVNQYGAKDYKGMGLTSVIIPNGITRIGEHAFYGNNLTSITIPNSVTRIDHNAFTGNPLLTSVTMPANVDISIAIQYNFESAYEKNGKKAGTYTRPPNSHPVFAKWTYRP
jgi:hypothetical protein